MKQYPILVSRFHRSLLIGLVMIASGLSLGFTQAQAAKAKTLVNWFIATGTNEQQIKGANALVEKFNASQDEIQLQTMYGCLSLKITNVRWEPNAPNQVAPLGGGKVRCQVPQPIWPLIENGSLQIDIAGPMSSSSLWQSPQMWVDLQPLIKSEHLDLSRFPKRVIPLFQNSAGLFAVPFAAYPTVLFYNRDLFDESGLAYPPAKFGEKYILDGKQVDWNWDTLTVIAKRLTLDSDYNDATNAQFDPTKIIQFGYDETWSILHTQLASYGDSQHVDAKSGKVQIPQSWRAKAQWLWNAVWKDHFMPSDAYINSDLLRPSSFASGHVAMAYIETWYMCCLADLQAHWDIGVVPSYHGEYYVPTDADGFGILKSSPNPKAAFKVLKFFYEDEAQTLMEIYGTQPSRRDLNDQFFSALSKRYPDVAHFSVVGSSFDHTFSPYNTTYFASAYKVNQRFSDLRNKLFGDSGSALNIDEELEKLRTDLQVLKDAPPK